MRGPPLSICRVSVVGFILTSVLGAQDGASSMFPPTLTPDTTITLALASSDPSLPGRGLSKALLCEITPSGPLTTALFWAESGSLDLFLRVEDAQTGRLLVEDDNSGGGKSPFAQIETREPCRLRVIVASTLPDQSGGAIANLRLAHETHETLTAPDIANSSIADADSRSAAGDHDGARMLVRDAVQRLIRIDGAATSHKLPEALWSLALKAEQLGDIDSSKALQEKVLEARSRALPDGHLDLQAVRLRLAITLKILGDFYSARALEEKVLDVFSRDLPDDHPYVKNARGHLANTLAILANLNSAKAPHEKLHEFSTRTLSDDRLDLQAELVNPADSLKNLDEQGTAKGKILDLPHTLRLQESVLENRSRTFPLDHPHVQIARYNLAVTLASLSDPRITAILRAFLQGARQRGRSYHGVLTTMQTWAALAASEPETRAIFGLARLDAEDHPELVCDSAATLLSRRQSAQSGQRLLRAIDLASGADRQRINSARMRCGEASARLSRITIAGETKDLKFDAVRGERDAAERAFSDALRSLPGAAELLADVSIGTLLAALRPEQAAVIFFRYTPCTRDAAKPQLTWHPPRYAAFVGGPGQELAWIDLGEDDAVRDRLETWLVQIADGDGDSARAAGSKLSDLLIAPLTAKIGSAREWLVLPDGDLHGLPLEALPEGEGVVGDHHRVVIVSDMRELLRSAPASDAETPTFVGFGDVDYDDQPLSEQTAPFRGAAADEKDQTHFGSLDSTGPEIEEISEVFKKAWGDDAKVRLLKERRASRRALEIFGPKTKFLHLATHGYFEPLHVPQRAASGFLDSQLGFGVRSSLTTEVHALSPFTLCGIALAGANLPPNEVHRIEGRMTGAQIADIDLTHCELAVISACYTAKGAGDLGPAIASFQTALHAAGARSAITALWRVPDAPTKELMVDFYRNLWLAKMSKAEALWRAKCNLREAKNKDGTPKYNLRDWAAWVLTGDPR